MQFLDLTGLQYYHSKLTSNVLSKYAELDSNGLIPSSMLPSYVDDVLEYTNKAAFPATGETGKIYIAQDTNLTYRWSGSAYVEISASLALGETSSTAYAGDKGKKNAEDIAALTEATANSIAWVNKASENVINIMKAGIETGTDEQSSYVDVTFMGGESSEALFDFRLIAATATTAGVMSAADKTALDNATTNISNITTRLDEIVATGGEPNTINSIKVNGTALSIAADKSVNIPAASASAAGVMTATQFTKLNGVETGAQVNKIESIKVNGVAQTITNKSVDITVTVDTAITNAQIDSIFA